MQKGVTDFIMKKVSLTLICLLWLPVAVSTADRQVVEIGVSGLACPFCVYGLEKNLKKLPNVSAVQVNLADSTARIVMIADSEADIEAIRQAITSAGFTPGDKITSATE